MIYVGHKIQNYLSNKMRIRPRWEMLRKYEIREFGLLGSIACDSYEDSFILWISLYFQHVLVIPCLELFSLRATREKTGFCFWLKFFPHIHTHETKYFCSEANFITMYYTYHLLFLSSIGVSWSLNAVLHSWFKISLSIWIQKFYFHKY